MSAIIDYYTQSARQYRRVWSDRHLHYGYTDATTRSHHDAMRKMADQVLDAAELEPGLLCVDAGCGLGGTAERAAQRFGVRVDGLTLVPAQTHAALIRIFRSRVWPRVRVRTGDYHAIPVPDATYDRQWFLESFCYADPQRALAEAFRVLKPGGRLVIADGFRTAPRYSPAREAQFRAWASCWALTDLPTIPQVIGVARDVGFGVQENRDLTRFVLPSSRRMARIARWTAPWRWLGLGSPWELANMRGAVRQRSILAQGLMAYHLLVLTKP